MKRFIKIPGSKSLILRINKNYSAFFFLVLFAATQVLAEEVSYPRTLTTNEIIAHYKQFGEVRANSEFELMVTGNEAVRECELCGTPTGYASVHYGQGQSEVCFYWDNVSNPESGCFSLVQTEERRFELRKKNGGVAMKYTVASTPRPFDHANNPDAESVFVYDRAILLDLTGNKPAKDRLETVIRNALVKRGWQIENTSQPDVFIGRLVKSSRMYRVLITAKEDWLGIGFLQGYGLKSDNWLRNLEIDIRGQL